MVGFGGVGIFDALHDHRRRTAGVGGYLILALAFCFPGYTVWPVILSPVTSSVSLPFSSSLQRRLDSEGFCLLHLAQQEFGVQRLDVRVVLKTSSYLS